MQCIKQSEIWSWFFFYFYNFGMTNMIKYFKNIHMNIRFYYRIIQLIFQHRSELLSVNVQDLRYR